MCTPKGKVLHLFLWSSQGPGPWVWVQSGLVQYSVSTSQPHPHAVKPQILVNTQAEVTLGWGIGKRCVGYLNGQYKSFSFFWPDVKVLACFKTFKTFSVLVLTFLTIINKSISLQESGEYTLSPFPMWQSNKTCDHIKPSLPWTMLLEYVGWKVKSLLGRKPPKRTYLERAEIDSRASSASVK